MRIIAFRTLKEFWKNHRDAETPLRAWYIGVKAAAWKTMVEVKAQFGSADPLDSERVIFNIGGNKYRLVASIWFKGAVVFVKFIGTHAAYDRIKDIKTVDESTRGRSERK